MKAVSCLLALSGLTAVSATIVVAVPTVTISTGLGTTLAALGLIKLKTAALLALTRNKRSANEDSLYHYVAQLENQQCIRRFLCEVASGELSAPDFLSTVESLKSESINAVVAAAELPYSQAVKYGAKVKAIKQCQNKYACPQTGQQILIASGLQGA